LRISCIPRGFIHAICFDIEGLESIFPGPPKGKGFIMKDNNTVPCSVAVSLFRGVYARVGHKLGVDVSYISRVARGERKSKIAEKAIDREYRKVLVLIGTRSFLPGMKGTARTRRKVHKKQ
jgi:hypothetical protein